MNNTLDKVLLTPAAVYAWHRTAASAAPIMRGVRNIPDEDAEPLPGGRLRIHVTHPRYGVLAQLVLGPADWSWVN